MILAQYLRIIRLAKDKKSCELEYVFSKFPIKKKFTTYTKNKRYLAIIYRCEFSTVNIHKTIPNKYNKQTVSYLNVSIYEFLSFHMY